MNWHDFTLDQWFGLTLDDWFNFELDAPPYSPTTFVTSIDIAGLVVKSLYDPTPVQSFAGLLGDDIYNGEIAAELFAGQIGETI